MNNLFPYRLYLVISEESCRGRNFIEIVEQVILNGVDIVQLREKKVISKTFLEKALRLQEVLSKNNIPLIINDNLKVAQQVNAFGIHVGNNDLLPTLIKSVWKECQSIGYSIEFLEQLCNPETAASDYLGISPVFSTATKTDTIAEWGLLGIRQIRTLTNKSLVAIGNMNVGNAYEVIKAGADCIAVVSAICQAENPAKAALEIRNQIEKAI